MSFHHFFSDKTLHVKSSVDTTTSKQDSKDLSGTLSMTMYGGGSGLGATLGYCEGHQNSDSITNTNAELLAKNINITTTNDASFKGATVRADDTLNLKVGGDLSVESQRDSSSSTSKGFNVSASASLGKDKDYTTNQSDYAKPEEYKAAQDALNKTAGARIGNGLGSTGASFGANAGTSQSKQTVLTSLTGDNVNVEVEGNTHIKGALIAAGETNKQGQFEDNGNLNLKTDTLTFANSSNSFNVGANIGFETKTNAKTKVEESTTNVNSSSLSLSSQMGYSASKTLATVGQGNLEVGDKDNSDDLTRLNRDTTKVNKNLYSGSTGTSVTAVLDHRLLTKDGQDQIKKEYEDMNKNMNIIAGTLPNANSNNPVEAAAGEVWNKLTKYLSLGIVPSNENRGGILAEIPILTGTKDAAHMALQVINKFSKKFNEKDYVKMEESNYYKSLSAEDKAFFDGKDIYVSRVPVEITPQSATYQNAINGMMNSEGEAIKNGLQQTGQSGTGTPVELTVAYNPTYGILPDLLEAFVDKSGIGTTGIAKQTGQFVNEVSTARGSEGSNYALHSQASALVYNGIAYVQTTTGFQPVGYYKAGVDENNQEVYKTPTFVSFGSPINVEDMKKLIAGKTNEGGLGYGYSGTYTKPNDFVGEVLGGNSGNNEQADLAQKANILNVYKLFTSDSPHSTYICENYADQGVQCGYRK